MNQNKKQIVSPAINNLLGEKVVDRLYELVVLEGNKRTECIWDIPYKIEKLGSYYSEFRFNFKWQSYLDPIVISNPYKFNTSTLRKEYFPERDFTGRTEFYLSSDQENLIMKYPLPIRTENPKDRRYIVIDKRFVAPHHLLDLVPMIEDKIELFTQDIIQLNFEKLKEILGVHEN